MQFNIILPCKCLLTWGVISATWGLSLLCMTSPRLWQDRRRRDKIGWREGGILGLTGCMPGSVSLLWLAGWQCLTGWLTDWLSDWLAVSDWLAD